LFDFGGGVVEVAGGFYFAVAEVAELLEGACVVCGEEGSDGVELEAEREAEGLGCGLECGEEVAGLGGGEEGSGAGFEEGSTGRVHGDLGVFGDAVCLSASNDRWVRRFCRLEKAEAKCRSINCVTHRVRESLRSG
jgi:hypothetical protein